MPGTPLCRNANRVRFVILRVFAGRSPPAKTDVHHNVASTNRRAPCFSRDLPEKLWTGDLRICHKWWATGRM